MLTTALVTFAAIFAPVQDAKATAQEVLNKGAAIFDTRDAMSMTQLYTEDAKVFWIERDASTGKLKTIVKDGRGEIEAMYRDVFKDAKEKTVSRNTVESALMISPDLMIIQGWFEPKVGEGKWAFSQERVKEGDKWLIRSLRIYIVSAPVIP